MFVRCRPTAYGLPPTAFTLTEMLVVIAIIAVLASLTSVAVMRALDSARQARIKAEVDGLHAAFEAYKKQYGSYPPCDLRMAPTGSPRSHPFYNAPLRRHLAQAFPKYNQSNLCDNLMLAGVDTCNFRPDQALVFWLSGFNRDPANPFTDLENLRTSKMTTTPFFDFDGSRLGNFNSPDPAGATYGATGMNSYFPPGARIDSTTNAPYVYFDSQGYGVAPDFTVAVPQPAQPFTFNTDISGAVPNAPPATIYPPDPSGRYSGSGWVTPKLFPQSGAAVPYWLDANGNGLTNSPADRGEGWVNPDSFQIIAPGLDGKYGADAIQVRTYKTGAGYDPADEDNVTNFCPKARLGDEKP